MPGTRCQAGKRGVPDVGPERAGAVRHQEVGLRGGPPTRALASPAGRAVNARDAVAAECLHGHSTQSRSRPSRRSCRPSRSAGWPSTSYVHDQRDAAGAAADLMRHPCTPIAATLTGAQAEEGRAPRAAGEAFVGTCIRAWAAGSQGLTGSPAPPVRVCPPAQQVDLCRHQRRVAAVVQGPGQEGMLAPGCSARRSVAQR